MVYYFVAWVFIEGDTIQILYHTQLQYYIRRNMKR
jgi:hypothetical protein